MRHRKTLLLTAALAALLLTPTLTDALGEGLGDTKEQLQLGYDLSVAHHGNGRVTAVLTVTNPGRLAPLTDIQLVIPNHESADGSGPPDMVITLQTTQQEGKLIARAHLRSDWARRAHFMLKSNHLDGQTTQRTWYYHDVHIAPHMQAVEDN